MASSELVPSLASSSDTGTLSLASTSLLWPWQTLQMGTLQDPGISTAGFACAGGQPPVWPRLQIQEILDCEALRWLTSWKATQTNGVLLAAATKVDSAATGSLEDLKYF